jgi:hypothetical protein
MDMIDIENHKWGKFYGARFYMKWDFHVALYRGIHLETRGDGM